MQPTQKSARLISGLDSERRFKHMSAMSDFEIRANNIVTAIQVADHRVKDFGYAEDSPEEASSRIVGMFVTWLTACEEARHQATNSSASYTRNVINALPVQDDPNWDDYIMPPPTSTLRERAEALWGVRIAFTHGDGDLNLISNQQNKSYAQNAAKILEGVSINGTKLILNGGLFHSAIRTMVQIRDVIP